MNKALYFKPFRPYWYRLLILKIKKKFITTVEQVRALLVSSWLLWKFSLVPGIWHMKKAKWEWIIKKKNQHVITVFMAFSHIIFFHAPIESSPCQVETGVAAGRIVCDEARNWCYCFDKVLEWTFGYWLLKYIIAIWRKFEGNFETKILRCEFEFNISKSRIIRIISYQNNLLLIWMNPFEIYRSK